MRPRMVRSPVDICLGTRPIQAEKSRPLANAAPLPIAATIALEMIGPMPGTVMTLRQLWQRLAKEAQSLSDDDAALEKKAANLIDHCGPLADQARADPVQRLQIQLFVGFGWNKACRSRRRWL